MTENSACRERGHAPPQPLVGEWRLPFRRSHAFSSSHKRQRTVGNQLPPGSDLHHPRQRLESLNHYQKKHDHFFKNVWLPSPPVQGKPPDPHAAQRREDTSRLREEGYTRAYQAGDQDRGQRRSREKQVEGKTKHGEDGDSHKKSKKKAKGQPVSTEKPKHRKKSNQDTTKEGRRSQREKKQPGKESTQERDLWEDAILGSCY
ncbi:lysine-rich coiled-coil protein 1-like [Leopardus geoffroyi]|uniref:lysine-rich coiled-coil protein 1-like n=1 Tax=Leopardus geoffroyi TaxID=46844 RepID=UPI001E2632AA|nr:lysine-rich coiled-coil protein 1-like [Leopardus geoffroyi]